jgi:hypothetical protein
MEGAALRIQNERALVWNGVMLHRMEKPPKFEEFTGIKRRPDRQSPEELNAILTALATAWGAEWVE